MNLNYHLTLASKSPRRQALLESLDLTFDTEVRPIDESFPVGMPSLEVAKYLACKKSKAFDNVLENQIIITSDTVVVLDNQILGKPSDKDEAIKMLERLSTKTHQVVTGVCLRSKNKQVSFSEVTTVTFDHLSSETIEYYIDNYKPYDKAGAYGIQEWIGMIGITKIEGDYYNVMGLPLNQLHKQLNSF